MTDVCFKHQGGLFEPSDRITAHEQIFLSRGSKEYNNEMTSNDQNSTEMPWCRLGKEIDYITLNFATVRKWLDLCSKDPYYASVRKVRVGECPPLYLIIIRRRGVVRVSSISLCVTLSYMRGLQSCHPAQGVNAQSLDRTRALNGCLPAAPPQTIPYTILLMGEPAESYLCVDA